MIRRFCAEYLLPILRRPNRYQVAALCWRVDDGALKILLLTSRETRRWILPKGWPMPGLGALDTAREEAWEEGGVRLEQDGALIGRYCYSKRMRGGVPVRTNVDVFAVRVTSVAEHYPEATERERRWVTLEEAAEMVDEPDLAALLRDAALPIAAPPAQQDG